MPAYQRIPSEDRWDIVNYIRYLNEPAGFALRAGGEQRAAAGGVAQ
jgi:hypothetical protein